MNSITRSWFDPPLVLDVGSLPVKCHAPGAFLLSWPGVRENSGVLEPYTEPE
jgi:hypothetical protein